MNTHTFQTKLESNVVQFFNIDSLIGKEVIISIIEIPKHTENIETTHTQTTSLSGRLKKYANPNLIERETDIAWSKLTDD